MKWGLVFYDETTEWVPVGTFRVDTVPYSATLDSAVTIRGVDRCADIVDDDFPQPRTFEAGSTTALIAQLIQETLPTASVYNRTTVRDERVPTLQYDGSRADLIQTLPHQSARSSTVTGSAISLSAMHRLWMMKRP